MKYSQGKYGQVKYGYLVKYLMQLGLFLKRACKINFRISHDVLLFTSIRKGGDLNMTINRHHIIKPRFERPVDINLRLKGG